MNHDIYIRSIRDAARGEVLGEELFLQLADKFDGDERRLLLHLADLEAKTAILMDRVLDRHGIVLQVEDARAETATLISQSGINSWQNFLDWIYNVAAPYVRIYDDLASNAYPEDRQELRLLALHERALTDYLEAERRGDPDAERHVRTALDTLISSIG